MSGMSAAPAPHACWSLNAPAMANYLSDHFSVATSLHNPSSLCWPPDAKRPSFAPAARHSAGRAGGAALSLVEPIRGAALALELRAARETYYVTFEFGRKSNSLSGPLLIPFFRINRILLRATPHRPLGLSAGAPLPRSLLWGAIGFPTLCAKKDCINIASIWT